MFNNWKNNIIKVFLLFGITLTLIILVNTYYFYKDLRVIIKDDTKKEARLVKDYILSMQKVYHQQFLSSKVELNEETLGFLPVHASTLISDEFIKINKYGYYARSVSDKPRNPKNQADKEELKAIDFFKNKNPQNNDEYFKRYDNKGKKYFQFATPLYIKSSCIKCHGKKEEVLPTIRKNYDLAYDYKVGDLRGVISIKIPEKDFNDKVEYFINGKIVYSVLFLILIYLVFVFFYKKAAFMIKQTKDDAAELVYKDALTGLNNRRFLNDFDVHNKLLKEDDLFYIAFLDIDYFKKINDTYGHDCGDVILREFSYVLKGHIEKEDVVCRYGGEEFILIIYNIEEEHLCHRLELIKQSIERTEFLYDNKIIEITVSIGYSSGNIDESFISVTKKADEALYEAKQTGRNKIVKY